MHRVHEETSNGKRYWYFHCPGCKKTHGVASHLYGGGPGWTFNDDLQKPTFSPSILVYPHPAQPRCHSFVRNGQIQFLDDCDHELKGQTVDLPEFEHFHVQT